MATPVWEPGHIYAPGSIVRPRSGAPVFSTQPANPGFEDGDTGWTKGTGWTIGTQTGNKKFTGSYSAQYSFTGTSNLESDTIVPVRPGQSITARCQVQQGASSAGQAGARVNITWYDSGSSVISSAQGNLVDSGSGGAWHPSTVTAAAPANAAFARIVISAFRSSGSDPLWVDDVSWDYAYAASDDLVFKAVQANAGYSGSDEPTWPAVLGQTVVDNEVTWEAVDTTRVVWEAHPILVSGSAEPEWPTRIGETVADGTVAWEAVSRRIEDDRCPQSAVVAIAASKIFAGDDDIIPFSATVNPLDWTTVNDAGYLSFGLQTYGSNPVTALGLYRSNVIAFNSEGFQMWQVDQDPANMALLDAVPVSCPYPRTPQPVANDLVFLSPVGVRNMNIAGASTNLQAGNFGEAVDPPVKEAIKAGTYEPFSIYWPGAGQYWLVFGPEAFVLTVNGPKDMSWSRYEFPEAITDWTLHGDDLYLRTATHKVWRMDEDALYDDEQGGDGEDIEGVMHWPFLDFNRMGQDKELLAFDLVCDAPEGVSASIGYDQTNRDTARTDDFVVPADTLTGTAVPMPLTAPSFDLRLTFAPGQKWEWFAANLYINDR